MTLSDEKYNGLREKLEKQNKWPNIYMFKFIMPADNKIMAQVESLFDDNATIYRKESKKGKYLSITVKDKMHDVEQVVAIYKKAEKINNLMIL